MVKNALKKSVSFLLCAAFLAPFFMVLPAKAINPWKVSIDSNMSREDCWMEAADHLATGLSRERIAVEIYTASQRKYNKQALYIHLIELGIAYGCTHGGLANPVCDYCAGKYLELFFEESSQDTIELGGDSDTQVTEFYNYWNRNNSGSYIYSALDDNKVVDVNGNSNKKGTKIQLWSKNKSGAQKFYILRTGDGEWCNIFKAGTFKCLDVKGGKAEAGVNVQLWGYNGTKAQDWKRIPVEGKDGYYYLKSRVGDYYLDACGGVSADGTQLQIWTPNQTTAQQWKIT